MTPFLEDVVYEPVRSGALVWPIAFECLIAYLRMIEAGAGIYTVSNVVRSAGGIDAVRAQAKSAAVAHFPAAFFRVLGGNPSHDSASGAGGDVYKGTVKGDNKSSKSGCVSWNAGNPHLAKHVDAKGCCRFIHACNQYVTDKGKGGQCLGPHKRKECDYEQAKKVSKPATE